MEYMSAADEANQGGCVFCDHLERGDDAAALILHRGSSVFVILNAFPYNTGHLMVAPLRHAADLVDLDPRERAELMDVTARSVDIVRQVMRAEGFNTGMNLGPAGGAGIPGHLHMHVVPRWQGDTNFMTVTAGTKVLPEMLGDTYSKLRPAFEALR